jgi:hypothetical protein
MQVIVLRFPFAMQELTAPAENRVCQERFQMEGLVRGFDRDNLVIFE